MFDNETAQFFTLLRSNTIGDASSIGLRSILESNIPVNVKTFFRADVEWLRAQEKTKEVRSPKFSYALPELRLLDEQIDLLLVNNYTFSRKEFDVTADKCIHFLLNYLCRPEWTLTSFFFDTAIRITAEEMTSKLRYCADYPYYREILSRYAETRQRTDVGSEEMKRLLSTIDDEICAQATASELALIAKPIFDFVGELRAAMRPPLAPRVPVRALIYFFEDKRLTRYAAAFSAVRDQDSSIQLTFPMLEMVLDAVWRGAAVPNLSMLSAAAIPGPVPGAPTAAAAALAARAAARNAQTDTTAEAETVTTTETITVRETETSTQTITVTETEPRPSDAPAEETEPAAAAQERAPAHSVAFDTLEDNEAPSLGMFAAHKVDDEPSADMFAAHTSNESDEADEPAIVLPPHFTESDRLTIMNALFNGNETLFETAVDTAVHAGTWDDAIMALDGFFADQHIDPFTKEAMMFTNILESWHGTLKK